MQMHVAAIDQGTTSTRCIILDRAANVVGTDQSEHRQIYPQAGWVEHDPMEIWQATQRVVRGALERSGVCPDSIAAVGLTNQRETVVIWNWHTGRLYGHAIVWQDTRTKVLYQELSGDQGPDRFRQLTGLPLATYFSGPKIRWALDHVDGLGDAARRGEAICGTIDNWLIWQLTGGPQGGSHVTDVTNASRTLLMNLHTLDWDETILEVIGIPRRLLPRIVPSSDPEGWGKTCRDGPFGRPIPICGALGDQQAAMLGQCCFHEGDTKNTYGTGCFMLLNTGSTPVISRHGLLTTVAYQLASQAPVYALEGLVAIAGSLIQWLRDNLGLIRSTSQIEELARSVEDSGGVYVVPAFSGLFAPHWRADARGVIVGLTQFVTKAHLARAALEVICYQCLEVLKAMRADAGVNLAALKVDGGMTVNDLLMQFQSDLLGIPVVRPKNIETTALGVAYAAGLAVGLYGKPSELRSRWQIDRTWTPKIDSAQRRRLCEGWNKAVQRSLDWIDQ